MGADRCADCGTRMPEGIIRICPSCGGTRVAGAADPAPADPAASSVATVAPPAPAVGAPRRGRRRGRGRAGVVGALVVLGFVLVTAAPIVWGTWAVVDAVRDTFGEVDTPALPVTTADNPWLSVAVATVEPDCVDRWNAAPGAFLRTVAAQIVEQAGAVTARVDREGLNGCVVRMGTREPVPWGLVARAGPDQASYALDVIGEEVEPPVLGNAVVAADGSISRG